MLYHAISMYHLLSAVIHSTGVKEPKTLAIPVWITGTMKNTESLHQFFDELCFYDANYLFQHPGWMTDSYMVAHFGRLERYREIYVWGTHFTMGVYLAQKNIPFIYCEDASGMLTFPERLEEIDSKLPKNTRRIKELGLYDGSAQSAYAVLCNRRTQSRRLDTDKQIIDFDPVRELSSMDGEVRTRIIQTFSSAADIAIPEDAVCILTQHFANQRLMTFEEQSLIYQLLVDYFFPDDSIVVKPHPSDVMYYSKVLPEASVIRETFPTELLPYIFDKKPKTIATISSTAVQNLRGSFAQIFMLDEQFERDFTSIHRYYAAVKLCRGLGKPCKPFRADATLVERLCELESVPYLRTDESPEGRLVIADDIDPAPEENRSEVISMLESLDDDSCVAFINTKRAYCWYDYYKKNLWEHMVPVVLGKRSIDVRYQEDEVIYVYSKNNTVLEKVRAMEIKKELKNAGLSVEKKRLTQEQERIAILEGLLEATENRLLYYIEREKEQS